MASSSSFKKSKKLQNSQDLISNMPDLVTDKILKRLSITMVAKTSLVSRKWRLNWLSHKYLIFDATFWNTHFEDMQSGWEVYRNIITRILLYHVGDIHEFHLYIPESSTSPNISHWLSFLSRNGVKKITLNNWSDQVPVPSHLFQLKELKKLRLEALIFKLPSYQFEGFACLKKIEFIDMTAKPQVLQSLIRKCPKLSMLTLKQCNLSSWFVIEAPRLERLTIVGEFGCVGFKNVCRLTDISLYLDKICMNSSTRAAVVSIESLARSSRIKRLEFGGEFCKFLAARGIITKLFPLALSCLEILCLKDIDLSDSDVFSYTFGMIRSCPCIKSLNISVYSANNAVQHKSEYVNDDNFKLRKLRDVNFIGVTGSSAELKLIECLLATSVVLERLIFKYGKVDVVTELKVSKQLMRLPRASTKAQLVCLED